MDVLGSFWDSFDGKSYHITQIILEHRWNNKKRLCLVDSTPDLECLRFKNRGGLLYMTNFKILQLIIQMPMHFNQGASHFMGLALDTKNVWGITLDWSFFLEEGSLSRYKGYNTIDGIVTQTTPFGNGFNGSGEWVLYRGGLMSYCRS